MEAWGRPLESASLASTRLAGTSNISTINSNSVSAGGGNCWNVYSSGTCSVQSQTTVFCVRCGTARGIITHWLRAETNRDMAGWARSLVQGSHNAISYQREFSFRCVYLVNGLSGDSYVSSLTLSCISQGRPSQLIIHLDRGLTLLDSAFSPAKIVWTYSFDKLKGSADDGNRILYLEFGADEGEIVSSQL